MDRQSHYYRQVQLLLWLIPFVSRHDCFALKGGAAINLFVRDFPRLSVDIDLVFLPMLERHEALQSIKSNLDTLPWLPPSRPASTILGLFELSRIKRTPCV
ncbi:nucleotidyl transferase AbiEii/AbiGii toxin family protein [Vreelandella olivaria]|uniref:nucleotidyl transferase AbiEii/AbiGii toxin family protein n=1 Tax=Vreelandella olivaria TaxID=390919 RepID=UPI00201F23CF|nr:nucleotidyl transferase AbiEii/AbiGii toxin family protein [Halomonas olivaria]